MQNSKFAKTHKTETDDDYPGTVSRILQNTKNSKMQETADDHNDPETKGREQCGILLKIVNLRTLTGTKRPSEKS